MEHNEVQEILNAKDIWLKKGNIAGAAVCNFLIMEDEGLDIIYDAENELVKEYRELLKRRLDTDSDSLMLMVNTEIERCIKDEQDELNSYLCDEIYEHFSNYGKEYPIQAVGLHIDIIRTLFYLGYEEMGGRYMRVISDTQKEVFGDESFLFCRSWSYIMDEALLLLIPDAAIIQFDEYMNLFSKTLKEEDILYKLCLDIASAKVKQEQKPHYLMKAVDLCQTWCKDLPLEMQKVKQTLIRLMSAFYYRNIGDIDMAIRKFQDELALAENIQLKLHLLCQLATMLLVKRDLSSFKSLLEEGKRLTANVQQPDEDVAEFCNIYGLYCVLTGKYGEALLQYDKAINMGVQLNGEEADDTIKYKCNRIMARYSMGEKDEAYREMQNLLNIVLKYLDYYPQSAPYILNNMTMMSFTGTVSSETVKQMKNVLRINLNKYDLPSVIMLKSNLYYLMMVSDDIYIGDDLEDMRKELDAFFGKYPYAEGYFQYLSGECYRHLKEDDILLGSKALDRIEEYFDNTYFAINSVNYFHCYYIKLWISFYKKDYTAAGKRLKSMWETVIVSLLGHLCHIGEDKGVGVFDIIYSYASLFVSSVQQYPELGITVKELYEFVLNVKYYENLFYCRKHEFCSLAEQKKWLSVKDIMINKKELVIECFDYCRYDMKDIRAFFGASTSDLSEPCRIYFSVQISDGFYAKHAIEMIGDAPFMELRERIGDIYESEEVTEIERIIWNRLQKLLDKKDKIYFCHDSNGILLPLAAIRLDENQYLGDFYQVIYCNTAKDIKDDVEIKSISDSAFFGMSWFDGDKDDKANQEIHNFIPDLPYVELEIRALEALTEGCACLDVNTSKEWFDGKGREIMHFATHASKGNDDETVSLIIGKDDTDSYQYLKDEDIGKLNWNGVKLAVFSCCETNEEVWGEFGKRGLILAAQKAGALFSITTWAEINDGAGLLFMLCFYRNLLRYGKICAAFYETQKTMRNITVKEILADDYLNIGMEYYLNGLEEGFRPFERRGDWALYLLQMN